MHKRKHVVITVPPVFLSNLTVFNRPHILTHENTNATTLNNDVAILLRRSLAKMQTHIETLGLIGLGYKATDSMAVRISGNITGDPLFLTPEAVLEALKMLSELKAEFPTLRLTLDAQLNQRIMYPKEMQKLTDAGLDELDVSCDTLDRDDYILHHQVAPWQWNHFRENFRLADELGLHPFLSFVDVNHPALDEKVRKEMPDYLKMGQTKKAISSFIQELGLLNFDPARRIRRWLPGIKDGVQERMKMLDKEYHARQADRQKGIPDVPFMPSATYYPQN